MSLGNGLSLWKASGVLCMSVMDWVPLVTAEQRGAGHLAGLPVTTSPEGSPFMCCPAAKGGDLSPKPAKTVPFAKQAGCLLSFCLVPLFLLQ